MPASFEKLFINFLKILSQIFSFTFDDDNNDGWGRTIFFIFQHSTLYHFPFLIFDVKKEKIKKKRNNENHCILTFFSSRESHFFYVFSSFKHNLVLQKFSKSKSFDKKIISRNLFLSCSWLQIIIIFCFWKKWHKFFSSFFHTFFLFFLVSSWISTKL